LSLLIVSLAVFAGAMTMALAGVESASGGRCPEGWAPVVDR
jgi:hypothetical protein